MCLLLMLDEVVPKRQVRLAHAPRTANSETAVLSCKHQLAVWTWYDFLGKVSYGC